MTMTSTVMVKPKSRRAKNKFANMLKGNPVVIVDRDTPVMMHLKAQTNDYWFWVDKINDSHWEIVK